jgi:hypothetical protein
MFSLKNGKAVKKNRFASQHFFGPNIVYYQKIFSSSYDNRYQLKIAPKQ